MCIRDRSKTLATIDTNAPIEIGLDDITYSGPHLENLAKFYEEMGFKQLRQALDLSGCLLYTSRCV